MALHTLNLWEIALGGAQIFLCGFILLFLVRSRSKNKQMTPRAPADDNGRNFNAGYIIEEVRQQTEMAFNYILDTINKERHTLETYFEIRKTPSDLGPIKSVSTGRNVAVSAPGAAELETADAIYDEIQSLADQGMSLTDIAERLNVSHGEVDLVIKLKRLRAESVKNKASSGSL